MTTPSGHYTHDDVEQMDSDDLVELLNDYREAFYAVRQKNVRLREALDYVIESCSNAIARGDWVVDGACDPDIPTLKSRFGIEGKP